VSKIKVSKGLIYLATFLSFLLSVTLWFAGYREEGLFVGIWVPSILSLGALMHSDRKSSQ
jgi:hypothetical protein